MGFELLGGGEGTFFRIGLKGFEVKFFEVYFRDMGVTIVLEVVRRFVLLRRFFIVFLLTF